MLEGSGLGQVDGEAVDVGGFAGVRGLEFLDSGGDARGVGGGYRDEGAGFETGGGDGEADARSAADDEDAGRGEFRSVACRVSHAGIDFVVVLVVVWKWCV